MDFLTSMIEQMNQNIGQSQQQMQAGNQAMGRADMRANNRMDRKVQRPQQVRQPRAQGIQMAQPEYPAGMQLSMNDSPAYPEYLTNPGRPRIQPGGRMGIGQLQGAMQPTYMSDEGGAFSPQVQRGSAISPIQGGGPSYRGEANQIQGGDPMAVLRSLLGL